MTNQVSPSIPPARLTFAPQANLTFSQRSKKVLILTVPEAARRRRSSSGEAEVILNICRSRCASACGRTCCYLAPPSIISPRLLRSTSGLLNKSILLFTGRRENPNSRNQKGLMMKLRSLRRVSDPRSKGDQRKLLLFLSYGAETLHPSAERAEPSRTDL